jgi:antitoxin MazE
MKVAVQKWGNSLAVRIPKAFAEDVGVRAGSVVEVSVADGRLVAEPVRLAKVRLADLLRDVTELNLHGEMSTGPAVGAEAW